MKDNETNPEDRLETNTRQCFDASVERLDAATRSRLAQARARAVEAAGDGRHAAWPGLGRLQLAGLGMAAALALAIVWLPSETPAPAAGQLAALDDIDLLIDEGEIELFEELEFFAWLEAQDDGASDSDADGNG